MPSALALSEYQPFVQIRGAATRDRYQARIALRQLATAPIRGQAEPVIGYWQGTTDAPEDLYLQEVMKAHARAAATVRWQRFVLDPSASSDVDALSETVESVFDAMAAYGPSFIVLSGLSPATVQGEHLAAVLRTTFVWRSEVPGWNDALTVAAQALAAAGVDPGDALFGLLGAE